MPDKRSHLKGAMARLVAILSLSLTACHGFAVFASEWDPYSQFSGKGNAPAFQPSTVPLSAFYGPNLAGWNLSGSNLSGANLSGYNLSGTNLSDYNLSAANLQGYNLSGANATGINPNIAFSLAMQAAEALQYGAGSNYSFGIGNSPGEVLSNDYLIWSLVQSITGYAR